jgi:hypothetical protein
VLDQDALDLIRADGIAGAVVQLGRARRLVVGDLEPAALCGLRMLDCITILQIGRGVRVPEPMIARRLGPSGLSTPILSAAM